MTVTAIKQFRVPMRQYNSLQEIFTISARHLLTQNRKSISNCMCLYRGKDNLMCAIGCLIPDDLYSNEMEKCTITNKSMEPLLKKIISESFKENKDNPLIDLLRSLQIIHDSFAIAEWDKELRYTAKCFGLEMPILESKII